MSNVTGPFSVVAPSTVKELNFPLLCPNPGIL
jgi:hypothetical protein